MISMMDIIADLNTIKIDDIGIILLENDLRHLVSNFGVEWIKFPEGAYFGS